MTVFVVSIIILFGAILLGFEMHEDPGYVMIVFNKHSIETSFWAALVALLIAFILFYFFLRLIDRTVHLKGNVQNWQDKRKLKKLQKLTSEGLYELAEGKWQSAEQSLAQAGDKGENQLINYLAAARAAQAQNAYDRRDAYLRKASLTTQGAEVAVGLTQAELQIQSHQWSHALITLKHLYSIAPKHIYVLKLLVDVYTHQQDWRGIKELLPALAKTKAITRAELDEVEETVAIAEIKEAAREPTVGALNKAWGNLSRALRYTSNIAVVYCRALIAQRQNQEAVSIIESALKKGWDSRLVDLYGLVIGPKIYKQISYAESWLKQRPRDAHVLLCLGRLCKADRQWEKAKNYLEEGVELMPSQAVYQALGEVLAELDEQQAAVECYKKGLSIDNL